MQKKQKIVNKFLFFIDHYFINEYIFYHVNFYLFGRNIKLNNSKLVRRFFFSSSSSFAKLSNIKTCFTFSLLAKLFQEILFKKVFFFIPSCFLLFYFV